MTAENISKVPGPTPRYTVAAVTIANGICSEKRPALNLAQSFDFAKKIASDIHEVTVNDSSGAELFWVLRGCRAIYVCLSDTYYVEGGVFKSAKLKARLVKLLKEAQEVGDDILVSCVSVVLDKADAALSTDEEIEAFNAALEALDNGAAG